MSKEESAKKRRKKEWIELLPPSSLPQKLEIDRQIDR